MLFHVYINVRIPHDADPEQVKKLGEQEHERAKGHGQRRRAVDEPVALKQDLAQACDRGVMGTENGNGSENETGQYAGADARLGPRIKTDHEGPRRQAHHGGHNHKNRQ